MIAAIPHIVFAIVCVIAGTVLAALGHPDQAYVIWAGAGVGGVSAAALSAPSRGAGADLVGLLPGLQRAMTTAAAHLEQPGGATTVTGAVRIVDPPAAPAAPPPGVAEPPLSAP